jgi:hypothetical protein
MNTHRRRLNHDDECYKIRSTVEPRATCGHDEFLMDTADRPMI